MRIPKAFAIYSDLQWGPLVRSVAPAVTLLAVLIAIPILLQSPSVTGLLGFNPQDLPTSITVDLRLAAGLVGVLGLVFVASRAMRVIVKMSISGLRGRLQVALEGAQIGVWEWDGARGVLLVDDACATMLGYAPPDSGITVEALQPLIHPDDRRTVRRSIVDHIRNPSRMLQFEYRIRTEHGSYKWILCRGKIIASGGSGQALRIAGTHMDISERKQAEAELHQLHGELEQRVQTRTRELEQAKLEAERLSRAKNTFLANMSHELRTPLTAIIGLSQMLRDEERLEDSQREHAQIIHQSGEHLLAVINDVLQMSRIDAGSVTLQEHVFDLHEVIQFASDLLSTTADSKGLDLQLVIPPDLPRYVRGDGGKLRQVLINLTGNAVKYTASGYVSLVTTFSPQDETAIDVCFVIEDSGCGMTPEELSEAFKPFSQGRAGESQGEGAGLGLAICKHFIAMMGGGLEVASEPGTGTRFSFRVPMQVESGAGASVPLPAAANAYKAPAQRVQPHTLADTVADRRLLVEAVAQLPEDKRLRMEKAVRTVDVESIVAVVGELQQEYPRLADFIAARTEVYAYDDVLVLLRREG